MTNTDIQLFRASVAHFPIASNHPNDVLIFERDGGLVVDGKKIVAIGSYQDLHSRFPDVKVTDYQGKLIVPGFIDSHVHYPQTEMIASYGEQLLNWLNNYTFPTEKKFACPKYAALMAELFIQQLVKNGTTTAIAYATVHSHSADALFRAASQRDMTMITGKVCMDQHCPDDLKDTAASAQRESAALIEQWHGKGRNLYALTPRFAPTSSRDQLSALGELAQSFPDVFIQTHLSENKDEIDWVSTLYPQHDHYLDVYDHYNLVRQRSVFGHCIHLPDESWQRLGETGAVAVFCPSSNLFLGSGLFDKCRADAFDVNVVLASDVGAGTSFNLMRTYGEAYKVSQLQGAPIDPITGLYMMTQGAAIAHQLDHDIGNLNPGTYADFVVLDPQFSELASLRIKPDASVDDMLFALSMLGDERAIIQTYIAGKPNIHVINKEATHALA